MSHNLVTEIKQKLTHSKGVTQFAFERDMSSKLTIWLSIPPVTGELSPYLRLYQISILYLTRDTLCRGKRSRVPPALHPESVSDWAPPWAKV